MRVTQLCVGQSLFFPGKPHSPLCLGGDVKTLPDLLATFACRVLGWQRAKGRHGAPRKLSEYTGEGLESNRLSP